MFLRVKTLELSMNGETTIALSVNPSGTIGIAKFVMNGSHIEMFHGILSHITACVASLAACAAERAILKIGILGALCVWILKLLRLVTASLHWMFVYFSGSN